MAMSKELEDAFNDQVTLEFAASYAYLQMAAHFESANLPGMAVWMRAQAEEERTHAMKFYDFVVARDNQVKLRALEAPAADYGSALDVFQAALAHEQKVTAAIRGLYEQAAGENDYESFPLLQWFLTEQVEEEATVSEIIDQLRLAGDDSAALLMMDRELGAREAEGDEH